MLWSLPCCCSTSNGLDVCARGSIIPDKEPTCVPSIVSSCIELARSSVRVSGKFRSPAPCHPPCLGEALAGSRAAPRIVGIQELLQEFSLIFSILILHATVKARVSPANLEERGAMPT